MKPRVGRPRKTVDTSRIVELASKGWYRKEIASALGIHTETLSNNYSHFYELGANSVNARLREKQIELALNGNPIMLVWLGKNRLNQADKQEIDVHKQMTVRMVVGIEQSKLNNLANGYWAEDRKELPSGSQELLESTSIEASTNEQKEQTES